ncbi:MAG TPA: glycoside hydrolase family 15 protein [Vicinamibacterales bacterium]|nr:glycoside hydrolase family 15 protein [Vicinamibacterales bacterium]
MPLRIEDYALIGDTQAAALVGRDGSIDWLCLPRFDSPACFAALLGRPEHGRWLLAPAGGASRVTRRYLHDSLVLATEFETTDGVVRIVDCMPPRGREPDVVRVVEGVRGRVRMEMELIIRFDYGSIVPWVERVDGVLRAIGGPDALSLFTPIETHGEDLTTKASFTVDAGRRIPFLLVWHPSHEPVPKPIDALGAPEDTCRWWEQWCGKCRYDGPWRDPVMRSLITLKALTYAPTGGIVAAATTSLPEWIGGVRNWDYRYCWLRDASFTLHALMRFGYVEEALAWRDWLLRAVAGDPEDLQIMYGPAGERRLSESTLDWLPGYCDSRPVRTGNAAVHQFQLDVYGEVLDTLHLTRTMHVESNTASWNLQCHLLHHLERVWQEPDEGIWEVRGPRRHFTHSKLMAWVAFDRAVQAVERFGRKGPVDTWRRLRATVHEEICRKAYDPERNTFTQFYGSRELDASVLAMPLLGFLAPSDPRVAGTIRAIEGELVRDGLVHRYSMYEGSEEIDGLPPGEGTFMMCSFWLADCYAVTGRRDEAMALFERLIGLANDVGLLSEEYDPAAGRMLGNFPQAFSHVGLLSTALRLAETSPASRDLFASGR